MLAVLLPPLRVCTMIVSRPVSVLVRFVVVLRLMIACAGGRAGPGSIATSHKGDDRHSTDPALALTNDPPRLIDAVANVGVELMGLVDYDMATGDGSDDSDKLQIWDGVDVASIPPSMIPNAEVRLVVWLSGCLVVCSNGGCAVNAGVLPHSGAVSLEARVAGCKPVAAPQHGVAVNHADLPVTARQMRHIFASRKPFAAMPST